MRRIAYIELDTHAEIAASFMKLARGLEDFSVDYFFSIKIMQRLGIAPSKNAFLVNEQNIENELNKASYSLVIIGTAHRYFNVFNKISKQNNVAVIAHNLNFSMANGWKLFSNCFKSDQIFRLKLLLKEGLLQAPQFYRENKLLVLDEAMATKNRKFLPVFFTENVASENREILTVVVPGSVSQNRRDYRHIFEKIKDFKNPTRLVLLGKANGKELAWIKNLEKTKPQHIDLVYFKEKVQPQEFSAWMKAADVLWCPVLGKTEFFSIEEYYGITKMTGNLGDAINYGKIAVFPKNYASHYSFIKPESGDIESQLISLKHAGDRVFFKDFDKMTIEKKLHSTLNNLI